MPNSFKCPTCKETVNTEKRGHWCRTARRLRGQIQAGPTYYRPAYSKPNKQSTEPGYMKRFGSRPNRYRLSNAVAVLVHEQVQA